MGCSPRTRKRGEKTRIERLCKVSPRTGLLRRGLALAGSSFERLGGRPPPCCRSQVSDLGTDSPPKGGELVNERFRGIRRDVKYEQTHDS